MNKKQESFGELFEQSPQVENKDEIPDESLLKKLVGMKLSEAKKLWENIRVTAIGEEYFVITADYHTDRINVRLSDKGFKVKEITRKILGKDYTSKHYEGDLEQGIIEKVNIG